MGDISSAAHRCKIYVVSSWRFVDGLNIFVSLWLRSAGLKRSYGPMKVIEVLNLGLRSICLHSKNRCEVSSSDVVCSKMFWLNWNSISEQVKMEVLKYYALKHLCNTEEMLMLQLKFCDFSRMP